MKLLVQPTRRFAAASVEFDYSRHMSFEVYRDDPNVTIWSLTGNDVLIMVQKYARSDLRVLLNAVVGGTADYYGDAEVEQSRTSIELSGMTAKGHRLSVVIAGTHLRQDFFPVQLRDASLVLMLQDTLDDDGSASEEGKKARDLLLKTFKIGQ